MNINIFIFRSDKKKLFFCTLSSWAILVKICKCWFDLNVIFISNLNLHNLLLNIFLYYTLINIID